MSDQEKLEEITVAFVKALIANKFEDDFNYLELSKRLAHLIEMEVKWKTTSDENKILMSAWGPVLN